MSAPRKTPEEQYQLIMECRSSGLSDYHWCKEHNINPGTLYNWVARLRKKACFEIPEPVGKGEYLPSPAQEVVPLEIIDDTSVIESSPTYEPVKINTSHSSAPLTIQFENASISLQNDISQDVLCQVLKFLGEHLC